MSEPFSLWVPDGDDAREVKGVVRVGSYVIKEDDVEQVGRIHVNRVDAPGVSTYSRTREGCLALRVADLRKQASDLRAEAKGKEDWADRVETTLANLEGRAPCPDCKSPLGDCETRGRYERP